MSRSGLLLRRLITVLSLAAALGFGLEPVAALASDAGMDGELCLTAPASQHPTGAGQHGSAHSSSCCGVHCVPALAADGATVPPPDHVPSRAIHPADTSENGIELSDPSPPRRP
jgi:hypothetical protein